MAVDRAYYEKEMDKYSNQLDAEVSSNIMELQKKDAEIAKILAYYEEAVYRCSNQLEDKIAEIAYYEKTIASVDDHMRATIAAKNDEIDVYRRRVNVMEEMEMAY